MTYPRAEQAGSATTENSEAGHRANGAGPFDQQAPFNSDAIGAREQAKRFRDLRAKLALRGHCLNRSESTDGPQVYFVGRWGYLKELQTLDDVQRFARSVGASE